MEQKIILTKKRKDILNLTVRIDNEINLKYTLYLIEEKLKQFINKKKQQDEWINNGF